MSSIPDWAHALGPPVFNGRFRAAPAEFTVTEILSVDFSDSGEHDWLRIRKTGANTHWVARQLARHARVPLRDVGYSGQKDRHAVTEQWFSARRKRDAQHDWTDFAAQGVEILEQRRHRRKLRRGTHRANRFRIAVRGTGLAGLSPDIGNRVAQIAALGVPNYFGEQRFGHDGANIALGQAVLGGRRVPRQERSMGLSALRALHFNEELAARVQAGTWNRIRPGDTVNLDGSGSIFEAAEVTEELEERCLRLDVHPCGTLPALHEAGVEATHRPLRMRVADLEWSIDDDALWLQFTLGRGCYATAVLREIAGLQGPTQ